MRSHVVFAGSLLWHGILLSLFPLESRPQPEVIEEFIFVAVVLQVEGNCFYVCLGLESIIVLFLPVFQEASLLSQYFIQESS